MYRIFKSYLSNSSGGIALYMGIAIIPIAITVGSAVDYSKVLSMETKAQASIDSAVLAAATTPDVEKVDRKTIATNFFRSNATRNGIKNADDLTPNTVIADGEISSTVTLDVPTAFLSIVGMSNVPVTVNAVATYYEEEIVEKPCIYLNTFRNTHGTLDISGDCGFHVSSDASNSFTISGPFTNKSSKTTTHGGFNGTATFNRVKERQPKQTFRDPLSDKSELVASNLCVDDTATERVIIPRGQTKPIKEGTYCHGWVFNGSGTLELAPGTYYLKKPIQMRGRGGSRETLATIVGTGVTIVFLEEAKFDVKGVQYKLGMYITPPESGAFKGISLYQGELSDKNDKVNTISGALNFSEGFSGIVYLPDMDFEITGAFGFKTGASDLGILVAKDFGYTSRGGTAHFHPAKAYETTESSGEDEDRRVYLKR